MNSFLKQEGGLRKHNEFLKKSQPGEPLVTIVTVVRNGVETIEQTIQSVLGQTYRNIEYIVIDGASTDGTADIIRKYEENIAYWLSEPDSGISDAFNKGIAVSTGSWINFLNAGDTFLDRDVIKRMQSHFDTAPIITAFVKHGNITLPKYSHSNDEPLCVKAMISHQGSFIHRDIFNDIGIFSLEFDIRMDYEFWLRCLKKYKFTFVDYIIISYEAGVSGSDMKKYFREEILANKIHHVHFIYSVKAWVKYMIKKYMPWLVNLFPGTHVSIHYE